MFLPAAILYRVLRRDLPSDGLLVTAIAWKRSADRRIWVAEGPGARR